MQINDPVILVRINQLYEPGMTGQALYDATRGVWKVGPRRDDARYALALYRGDVLEVFEIEGWQPAGMAEYLTRPGEVLDVAGRWEFRGRIAEEPIRSRYRHRSVKSYLPKGSRSPIVYVNC